VAEHHIVEFETRGTGVVLGALYSGLGCGPSFVLGPVVTGNEPRIRRTSTVPAQSQSHSGPNVNAPRQVDVNVNFQQSASSASRASRTVGNLEVL